MAKSHGIKISPKHGLNPTLTKCFWCGADTGVALLGKLPGDKPAPREIILNYEPCDECKAKFEQGIFIFEATTEPQTPDQQPITSSTGAAPAYPTGRFVVMNPNSFIETPPSTTCAMMPEDFQQLLDNIEEQEDLDHEYQNPKPTTLNRNPKLN